LCVSHVASGALPNGSERFSTANLLPFYFSLTALFPHVARPDAVLEAGHHYIVAAEPSVADEVMRLLHG